MANSNLVSLPSSEKDLIKWFQEKQRSGDLSPSLVWRDALTELKRQDDIKNSINAPELQKRLEEAKKVIGSFHDFLEKKGLNEDWFKYQGRQLQKEVYKKKGIETTEIDNLKQKKKNKPN